MSDQSTSPSEKEWYGLVSYQSTSPSEKEWHGLVSYQSTSPSEKECYCIAVGMQQVLICIFFQYCLRDHYLIMGWGRQVDQQGVKLCWFLQDRSKHFDPPRDIPIGTCIHTHTYLYACRFICISYYFIYFNLQTHYYWTGWCLKMLSQTSENVLTP